MAGAAKLSAGKGGAVLEDVPHLTDWLPNLRVSILDRRMVWCTTGSDIVLLDAVHHYMVPFCNNRCCSFRRWMFGGLVWQFLVLLSREKFESLRLCLEVVTWLLTLCKGRIFFIALLPFQLLPLTWNPVNWKEIMLSGSVSERWRHCLVF
jgi:hypothetical protein